MRDVLAVVGLVALLYLGLCWVGHVPPGTGLDVLAHALGTWLQEV